MVVARCGCDFCRAGALRAEDAAFFLVAALADEARERCGAVGRWVVDREERVVVDALRALVVDEFLGTVVPDRFDEPEAREDLFFVATA